MMVKALGNEVLSELYQSLGSRQQRVAMTALTADPNRVTRIQQEHRALLAASAWMPFIFQRYNLFVPTRCPDRFLTRGFDVCSKVHPAAL